MAKHDDALFEESSQGAVSAVTAFVVLLSFVLVFGGMVLFSYGFGTGDSDLWIYAAGLAATVFGFIVPFTILPKIGK